MSKQLLVNNQLTVHEMFTGTDQVSYRRIFWMRKRERDQQRLKNLYENYYANRHEYFLHYYLIFIIRLAYLFDVILIHKTRIRTIKTLLYSPGNIF